jgi:hypothetical protein
LAFRTWSADRWPVPSSENRAPRSTSISRLREDQIEPLQSERLDRAYLRGWAERLGLSDLLGRALGEAQVDRPR